MNEKRQYQRQKLLAPLEIKSGNKSYPCVSLNISEGGFGVICNTQIELGNCMVMMNSKKLAGKIVYRKKHERSLLSEEPVFQYGIALANRLKPEDRKHLFSLGN